MIFSTFSSINVASGTKTASYTGLYPSSPGSPTDAQLNSLPKDKKRARVLYNYKAFDSSELMLTADEVISVLIYTFFFFTDFSLLYCEILCMFLLNL